MCALHRCSSNVCRVGGVNARPCNTAAVLAHDNPSNLPMQNDTSISGRVLFYSVILYGNKYLHSVVRSDRVRGLSLFLSSA